MSRKFQALRFAARQRRHRLAQAQIIETHVGERLQACQYRCVLRKECQCFVHRHLEDVGDRLAVERHFEHFGTETFAVAIGAAQIHVGQELHLDVLEAVAAAGRAATVARIEAERGASVATLFCERRLREEIANRIEGADVTCGIRARRATDRRLIHHDHVTDQLVSVQCTMRARRLGRLAFVFAQRRVEHVLHERGFARARYARDAHEPVERKTHVDVFEIVFGDAGEGE